MKAKATYKVKKWEEHPYHETSPEIRMTKASVEYGFSGDLEGTGSVEYLMFYSHFDPKDQHIATASYVALIRFQGSLGKKSGSFVMIDNGAFGAGTANSILRIAEGSGTGMLRGITGTGMYRANQEGLHFELEYDLPNDKPQ